MVSRSLLLTLLAAALTGCGSIMKTPEFDAPIAQEKYPVRQDASPECISAAKRASHWCIGYAKATLDPVSSGECNNAQWDYARNCR